MSVNVHGWQGSLYALNLGQSMYLNCLAPLPAQRVNSPASLETLKPLTATELLLFYRCIKKQFLNADMISFSFSFCLSLKLVSPTQTRQYYGYTYIRIQYRQILRSFHPSTAQDKNKGRDGKKEPSESIRILPLAALDWNPPSRCETSTWALLYSVYMRIVLKHFSSHSQTQSPSGRWRWEHVHVLFWEESQALRKRATRSMFSISIR